ncbi:MAG: ABC transporter substrate-binding protein [Labedaea sp.]
MASVRRRTLLGAGLAALGASAGCAGVARTVGLGDSVRVAVSWSATELAAFRAVLAGWGDPGFELVPFGDDIDAALGARTTGRPNVVALPRPGLVAGNMANLEPIPDELWHEQYNRGWSASLPAGRHFALPFKRAHGSVVWYRRQVFEELHLEPPPTWDKWLAHNEVISKAGRVAPLALGGADGWMLTGFFGNVLLRNFVATYDELTRPDRDARLWQSSDVRAAFRLLGEMWGRPGTIAGGARRALVQQFPDAVLEVFRFHRAAMVVVPDFAESVIRHFGVPQDEVGTFPFPAITENGGPFVQAGDLLVLTRPASKHAVDLIKYLGSPEAPVPWIRDTGGFIAANPDTSDRFYSTALRVLAAQLRDHDTRFDLADQLGRVGGRDGLQRVLVTFLKQLADGVPVHDAVDTATGAMMRVEAG